MLNAAVPPIERPSPSRGSGPATLAVFVLLATALAWLSLAAPHNHDESQYVAATALSAGGWRIFADFLSLQTPLHAWIYAPVALAFPGHVFVALRLATAATALATLALVHAAQRRAGTREGAALMATVLLAGTAAFQFSAGVIRNDMLPVLLTAGALWCLAGPRRALGVAGLLLGLAVSAKVSFLPVALASAAVLGRDRAALIRHLAGIGCGLLPCVLALALAPDAFWHGVIVYGGSAPFDWYRANGAGRQLGLAAKTWGCLEALARGPALAVLVLLCWRRLRPTDRFARSAQAMVAGGLVGLLLPTPTHLQYAAPVLAPLFVLAGPMLERLARTRTRVARLALLVFAGLALVGSGRGVKLALRAHQHRLPALSLTATAHQIGQLLGQEGRAGPIATLSPDRVVDSGRPLDPRFATGPFVLRSGRLLSAEQAQALHVVTPATIGWALDGAPPAAILTGYEGRTRRFRLSPDRVLSGYAERSGWRPRRLADGQGVLWLPPAGAAAPGTEAGDRSSTVADMR